MNADPMAIIIALISGGLITELLRLLFSKFKINSEQRAHVNVEMIKKRIEAIQETRKMCNMLNVYESLNLAHPENGLNQPFLNCRDNHTIYAAVLEDRTAWMNFTDRMIEVNNKYKDWLDCEVGAWLLYLDTYGINLSMFIGSNGLWEQSFKLGAIFIADFRKWQREFDDVLVKKMNKIPLKNEAHTGKIWDKHKNKMEKRWRATILYNLLNNQESEISKVVQPFITSLLVTDFVTLSKTEESK